ncbi:MAG: hypothetical protein JWR26_1113 [Pedosphaera sp.]|nr:hypothetical protein [Pedosphaera sp.]
MRRRGLVGRMRRCDCSGLVFAQGCWHAATLANGAKLFFRRDWCFFRKGPWMPTVARSPACGTGALQRALNVSKAGFFGHFSFFTKLEHGQQMSNPPGYNGRMKDALNALVGLVGWGVGECFHTGTLGRGACARPLLLWGATDGHGLTRTHTDEHGRARTGERRVPAFDWSFDPACGTLQKGSREGLQSGSAGWGRRVFAHGHYCARKNGACARVPLRKTKGCAGHVASWGGEIAGYGRHGQDRVLAHGHHTGQGQTNAAQPIFAGKGEPFRRLPPSRKRKRDHEAWPILRIPSASAGKRRLPPPFLRVFVFFRGAWVLVFAHGRHGPPSLRSPACGTWRFAGLAGEILAKRKGDLMA